MTSAALDTDALLAVAGDAVDRASAIFLEHEVGALTAKGERDYASEVDYAIERALRAFLADATPHIGFLGEEDGGADLHDGAAWVLDPVDGTVNYSRLVPLCGISLGLVLDGTPTLGVIDLPHLRERYTAAAGRGAYLGTRRLSVSATHSIDQAIVNVGDYAVGRDAERKNRSRLAITSELAGTALRVRMIGAASIDLAWLAAGRNDAIVMLSNNPWDTAAGVTIAREAGAVVLDADGSPHTMTSSATIAANPGLIGPVLDVVRRSSGLSAAPRRSA